MNVPRIKRDYRPKPIGKEIPTREPEPRKDPRNSRSWRKFREAFLARNPLCSDCMGAGFVRGATDVHHVRALRDGGPLYDSDNCLALCHGCHSRRTAKGE
jgi:5-methylcytosine-specific restriction protein A